MDAHRYQRHLGRAVLALISTVAAVVAGIAPPAQAAPPTVWGFAYVDDPTVAPWTVLDPTHQGTSAGSTALGGKVGAGRFQVMFKGMGLGPVGNVHVTAVDPGGHYCDIVGWDLSASGADEIVDVACYKPGGVPDDSPFTVLWTVNSLAYPFTTGAFASVQYVLGSGPANVYTSSGGAITITQTGTGRYNVRFGKVIPVSSQYTGTVMVTAQRSRPTWCKVASWDPAAPDLVVNVSCYNQSGKFIDSGFTASYQRERTVVSADIYPKMFGYIWSPAAAHPNAAETNYNQPAGGAGFNTVSVIGPFTLVDYPAIFVAQTHVQVTAYGADNIYCGVNRLWLTSGTVLNASAVCFKPSGAQAPGDVFVAATSSD